MAKIYFDKLPAGVVLSDPARLEIAQEVFEELRQDTRAAMYSRLYRLRKELAAAHDEIARLKAKQ